MVAIAHIVLSEISARSETGGSVSLMEAVPVASARLVAPSAELGEPAVSAATAFEADGANQFWHITAHISSSIFAKVGIDPVATGDGAGCWYVPMGTSIDLAAEPGQRVAICVPE